MRRTSAYFALLVAILLVTSPLSAQDAAAPAPAPTPVEQTKDDGASAASVAGDARAALATLSQLGEDLGDSEKVAAVREALPELEKRLRSEARETTEKIEVTEGLTQLGDIQSRWRNERLDLDAWTALVTAHAVEIGERLVRAKALRGDWERRLEEAKDPDVPKIVRTRIREVLAATEVVVHKINVSQAQVLELQGRLEDTLALVVGVIDAVVGVKDRARGDVLAATAPPVWQRLAKLAEEEDLFGGVVERFEQSIALIQDWAVRRQESLMIEAVILMVLVATTLVLRPRAREVAAEDESLTVSAAILQHPLSVGVVVTILLFSMLHPELPRPVRTIHGFIAVPALLIALRPAFGARSRPVLYWVLFFFVSSRIRDALSPASSLSHAIYGIELLAVTLVLLWLYRSGRLREMAPGPTWRWILDLAQPVALGLMLAALVADVFGWLGLSRLLGRGTLQAITSAFGIWALLQLTQAIIAISFRSRLGQRLHVIRRRGDVLRRSINLILQFGFGYYWILTALDDFTIREPVVGAVAATLSEDLSVGALAVSAGDILTFVVAIFLAIYASRFVAFFLSEEVMPRVRLPRGVPNAINTTARYTVLLLGFAAAVSAAGLDLTKFAVIAGALGVGIGFGLQNIVNNFISGFILLFERPIKTGDTISLGELMGDVKRIGIRASIIRSFDGAEVIVPNANLVSDQVINWTLSDRRRRMEIPVGVAYGTDPERVIELLRSVLADCEELSRSAPQEVHFMGFGDSSLDFRVRASTDQFDDFWDVRTRLAVSIHRALADAGIRIPFPQRDIHMSRSFDDLEPGT